MACSLLIHRTLAIVAIGVMAGALHSAFVPIKARPDPTGGVVLPKPKDQPAGQQATQPPAPQPPPAPTNSSEPPVAPPKAPPESVNAAPPAATNELNITLAESKALFDKDVPFIDARHLEEYEKGHVLNAFWASAEEFLGGKRPEALNFLDPEVTAVVYCGGGNCDASHNLVVLLQKLGFKSLRIMADGYPAWEKAGHPTATGKPFGGE